MKKIDRANSLNLMNLWKIMTYNRYTLKPGNDIFLSKSWPYKLWFNWERKIDLMLIMDYLQKNRGKVYLPLPEFSILNKKLIEEKCTVLFQQKAMFLPPPKEETSNSKLLDIKQLKDPFSEEVLIWTDVAASSFGYDVDSNIIKEIISQPKLNLFLGYLKGEGAVTAILFENSGVNGIHMLGVPSRFRRQGLAKEMMQFLIKFSIKSGNKPLTLQASSSGEKLYKQLGFKNQFLINNYIIDAHII